GEGLRLVLCYASTDPALTPGELTGQLRAVLPSYCVPERAVRLDAFPLTANGKVDRRVLTASLTDGPATEAAPAAGELVATMFSEVACRIAGGPQEPSAAGTVSGASLVALGGTSLDAMRLCARVTAAYGVRVPVGRFLQEPTPARLATLVTEALADAEGQRVGADQEAGTGHGQADPDDAGSGLPLTGMRAHFTLAEEFDPGSPSVHCHRIWRVAGPLDLKALDRALNDLHQRHEALRTAYRLADGPVALPGRGPARIELEVLTSPTQEDLVSSLETHLLRPLRVQNGRVWRAAVVPDGPDRALFGVTVHHVAFDGWAEAVFTEELSTAYRSRLRHGEAARFAHRAPVLAQVVAEQSGTGDPAERRRQLERWRAVLDGVPELSLPRTSGPPAGEQATVSFPVAPETVCALERWSRGLGNSPFLPLLAGYHHCVRQVLGQADFAVGVPVARRWGPLAQRAVSCLVDVVCVRIPPGPADEARSLAAVTARAREAVRQALADQDVTFAEVVAAVAPPRTDRSPLYQTLFALQSVAGASPVLELCSVEAVDRPSPAA
ncbi:hypothetical protein N566_04820, partial [Streptomycetaceae bacterium MP113-05]